MAADLTSATLGSLFNTSTIFDRYGTVLLALAVTYPVLLVTYNVLFHPLRKYPGPRLMAASIIPIYWYRVRGHGVKIVLALHDQYGSIVRLAPNELSFTDSAAWKDIYGHHSQGKQSFQKDVAQFGPDLPGVQSLFRGDDPSHARQRRIFAHAFSDKTLKEQESLIAQYVELLIKALQRLNKRKRRSEKVDIDMVKLFNFTTFDVMGDLMFGESLHMLRDGEYIPWVKSVFLGFKFLSLGHAIRRWPLLNQFLPYIMPKSLAESRKQHFQFSIDRVDQRMAQDVERPDIWNLVIKNSNTESISKEEMYSNATSFMAAGTETTATLLSGLTWLLCKNPDKMQRLIDEIRAFKSITDLTISNLQQLKYLHACLDEGLRVYHPFPVASLRIVPDGGAFICGERIPEGVSVGVPHLASYRSAVNFNDPLEFHPERWLSGPESEPYASDNKAMFQPFSFGPRNCLGKNLAYHEMRLILAAVLWHFDIELVDKEDVWTDQKNYELWEKKPLIVNLTPATRDEA